MTQMKSEDKESADGAAAWNLDKRCIEAILVTTINGNLRKPILVRTLVYECSKFAKSCHPVPLFGRSQGLPRAKVIVTSYCGVVGSGISCTGINQRRTECHEELAKFPAREECCSLSQRATSPCQFRATGRTRREFSIAAARTSALPTGTGRPTTFKREEYSGTTRLLRRFEKSA
jgi:hypothetical protein